MAETNGPFEGWVTASENIARDAQLLEAGRPAARVAILRDRAASHGVGARSPAVLAALAAAGIPVVLRASGGTWVLHEPGDVVWTLVLPRDDPRAGQDYARAYARLGSAVVAALAEFGIAAGWSPPLAISTTYCFLGSRGEVLTCSERVLGGAAQHVTRRALLHHGVLAFQSDHAALQGLFGLDGAMEGHLTDLHEQGLDGTAEAFATRLSAQLGRYATGAVG